MKKNKQPELKTVSDLEEGDLVERLKVNMHGMDEDEVLVVDDIDSLLMEESPEGDEALDHLFKEEKKNDKEKL